MLQYVVAWLPSSHTSCLTTSLKRCHHTQPKTSIVSEHKCHSNQQKPSHITTASSNLLIESKSHPWPTLVSTSFHSNPISSKSFHLTSSTIDNVLPPRSPPPTSHRCSGWGNLRSLPNPQREESFGVFSGYRFGGWEVCDCPSTAKRLGRC